MALVRVETILSAKLRAMRCDGRVFFVEEIARVVGKFILAAKDKVLIVVKHAVFSLVAHGDGRFNRYFKDSRAAFVVEQHAAVVETLDVHLR